MASQLPDHPLEVLTFALGGEIFAVEASHVQEILDLVPITEVPTSDAFLNGLINVRGKVVPLADLRLKLGMARTAPTIDTRIIVLEIEFEDDLVAVGVLAEKVYEITEMSLGALADAPRIGMRWRHDFIRCIAKRGQDFIAVLALARLFQDDETRAHSDFPAARGRIAAGA